MTENDSITARFRALREGAPVEEPVVLVAGSDQGCEPDGSSRMRGFDATLVVGRRTTDPSEPSLVLHDPTISSRHLSISRTTAGEFELTDLGSTNGTVVNGTPVTAPVKIDDGAIIFAGSHVMVFRTASASQMHAIEAELEAPLGPVATVNPSFAMACHKMRLLATTREDVLLLGEMGTGKEIYARSIHRASGRKGEFVALDCASTPPELVDATLFGGSDKAGVIEQAAGGTLYLDEICEIEPRVLAKLLRITEQDPVTSKWAASSHRVDVRIVASTSRTAASENPTGLPPGLAARFGTEPVRIPPLRERIEDLGALSHALLKGRSRSFELAAFQALCLHTWPGNVRELRKTLIAADALAQGSSRIGFQHLPSAVTSKPRIREETRRRRPRPAPTAQELEVLLRRHRGNVLRVSRELDRKPAVVYRWARRFGLEVKGFRSARSSN